jgi:hypothetical protein
MLHVAKTEHMRKLKSYMYVPFPFKLCEWRGVISSFINGAIVAFGGRRVKHAESCTCSVSNVFPWKHKRAKLLQTLQSSVFEQQYTVVVVLSRRCCCSQL